jgi:hypothetical protein
MGKRSYALEPNGPQRLEISWQRSYKNLSILLDGHLIGVFNSKKELESGRDFCLPDGSTLGLN